jgi:nitroreductase
MKEIYERRSIRKYTEQEISDEDMQKILKAGMNAPSAHNLKPYDLIVVRNKETLKKLADCCIYSHMLNEANAAIVVCSSADDEKTPYWEADCGAVTENILLEATSLGIGTCWLGGYPDLEKTGMEKKVLGVPENYQIFCVISMGYPAETRKVNDNYYEEKVHYEKF